jgi:uncharacterized protein (DUF2384 family)
MAKKKDKPEPRVKPPYNETERILSRFELGLTDEQIEYLEDQYYSGSTKDMIEITRACFGDEDIDCHTDEWNSVRKYMAKLQRGVTTTNFSKTELETIRQMAPNAKPKEIAEALFPGKKILPLGNENKLVSRLLKAMGLVDLVYGDDGTEAVYQPPTSDKKIIAEINKNDINANFDINDLTSFQKKCITSLRNYLKSYRFCAMMNVTKRKTHRDMFEATFIMSTYDKPDLNADEFNMYISLCENYVIAIQLKEQMEGINQRIDEAVQADSEDSGVIQMSMTKIFSDKMVEYDKCQLRMKQMQESLSSKRSERLTKTAQVNQSLSKFVDLWRAEEERKKFLIIAEARNLELKDEYKRIESASEHIAHIMGMDIDEITNA